MLGFKLNHVNKKDTRLGLCNNRVDQRKPIRPPVIRPYPYRPAYETKMRTLQWRHNGRDGVSNHQPHHCLLNRLFGRKSKKTSTLRVTGLCADNSPRTGEFPAQMASNAECVSIWWRHHGKICHPRHWHTLGKIIHWPSKIGNIFGSTQNGRISCVYPVNYSLYLCLNKWKESLCTPSYG